MNDLEIRPFTIDETPRVIELLTWGESEMRKRLLTASVSGALSNPQAKTIGLVAASGGEVLAAAIASALSGGTGVLVGLRTQTDCDPEVANRLSEVVYEYLSALEVNFLQGTCSLGQAPREWATIGLKHLADLDYLSADLDRMKSPGEPELEFRSVDAVDEAQLVELVQRTYRDTLDCPQMSQYRSASETLASYQVAETYTSETWRIGFLEGSPVACVFGLPFSESSIMELTYMGVIPEARGHGYGSELVDEVVRMSRQRQFTSISLAVDHANAPAREIYEKREFLSVYAESVWGRRLA